MAVRRRKNWLTHIVLITLLCIILFPILWVITTSIRKQNAAFSPYLFPHSISFENYKELIHPEKNLYDLGVELTAIYNRGGKYNTKTVAERQQSAIRVMKRIDGYIRELEKKSSILNEKIQTLNTIGEEMKKDAVTLSLGAFKRSKDRAKQLLSEFEPFSACSTSTLSAFNYLIIKDVLTMLPSKDKVKYAVYLEYLEKNIPELRNGPISPNMLKELEKRYKSDYDALRDDTQIDTSSLFARLDVERLLKLLSTKVDSWIVLKEVFGRIRDVKRSIYSETSSDNLPALSSLFDDVKPLMIMEDYEGMIDILNRDVKVTHDAFKGYETRFATLKERFFNALKTDKKSVELNGIDGLTMFYNTNVEMALTTINRDVKIFSDAEKRDKVHKKVSSEYGITSIISFVSATVEKYYSIWKRQVKQQFLRWMLNSIIVASVTAAATVLISALAAYPYSRLRFLGRRWGLVMLMLIQMFPAMMMMVAIYTLLKFLGTLFSPLGLDTLGGLALAYLGGGIAFYTWLMKGYFDTIPATLEESAMIDGATRFQTFYMIVLPLAKPVLAVVAILSFIGNFSEFLLAKVVLSDPSHFTYAVGLQTFVFGPYETEWGIFSAAALLGALPMLILFLSLQRYLVSGLTQGAVKG